MISEQRVDNKLIAISCFSSGNLKENFTCDIQVDDLWKKKKQFAAFNEKT